MIRIFTGLAIPDHVAKSLALLRGGLSNARWIEDTDYHLTLHFIGNIEESIAGELDEQLARMRHAPVEVILDGLHAFGGNKPRSIVVTARATPSLLALHASQERLLRRLGIPFENRKYSPHVTIARLKSTPASVVADYVNGHGYFRPLAFICNHSILYSSARPSGGGPYVAEAEYELAET